MKFRLYYEVLGGHTHVRVFAGKGVQLALSGKLVFRNEEWEVFNQLLFNLPNVQVLKEGEVPNEQSTHPL